MYVPYKLRNTDTSAACILCVYAGTELSPDLDWVNGTAYKTAVNFDKIRQNPLTFTGLKVNREYIIYIFHLILGRATKLMRLIARKYPRIVLSECRGDWAK